MKELTNYNTYKIKTYALDIVYPKTIDELITYINNNKYIILGSGSNVILPDTKFNGIIIKLDYFNKIYKESNYIYVESGYNLNKFIKYVIESGYNDLTNLFGIPGTIGGAIKGNAGCFGSCIFDNLKSILVLRDNDIILIRKEDIDYSYRFANFNKKDIIIGALFIFYDTDISKSKDIMKNNLESRKKKQPLEYPNAGSVFKNPDNDSAGRIIEECGLKGYKINNVMVSDKHANFIINLGNGKSSDIIKLIKEIKKEVKKKKNIDLELEQVIIKW